MNGYEIVGHTFGVLAVVGFALSYQLKTKNQILFAQTAATAMMCLQYLFIGAYSGFALNVVGLSRNLVYFVRDRLGTLGKVCPVIFALALAVVSGISWEGWHSLLILSGLVINTIVLGYCTPMNIRRSILLTSTLILVYNCFVGSYAGITNEAICIVSATLGLIRYSRRRAEKNNEV